ncbi:MAG: tetratricopeptide repeat protein [Vicinamibacteria bacterium]|nr:tetratricopeptide repeat protein [Vicinamibacteria bacterium]
MRTRSRAALLAAAIALAGLSTSACGYFSTLKAQMAFKDANLAYQTQDYQKAIEKYKEALVHKPDLAVAYFYLGNSYDNLYKPARKGEAANDANLQEAVSYYRKATETIQDPKLRKLSFEYLLASYGNEKLNDPSQAEPIVKKMIESDPDEPNNYYALAKIYEDAGNYEEAEKMLLAARDRRPKDATTYMQMAAFYNRQGRFDKTIEALEARAAAEPNNPEAYYTIATYLWDKTFRDFRLKEPERRAYLDKGVAATDKAIAIKGDYLEAIVYKGLLLRLQANIEKDRARQQALLKEADALRDRAKALQKAKQAGAGA